jgi:hypothetical protein
MKTDSSYRKNFVFGAVKRFLSQKCFIMHKTFISDHLREPGIDGRIILKWIFKKWDGAMDWIEIAQNRDRWRAIVNAVMNLRVP